MPTSLGKIYQGNVQISGGGGGISGGYNISFSVDGTITKIISITQGDSITNNPFTPTKTNYQFGGWSLTDGGATISYPYTPSGDVTLYCKWYQWSCTVANLGSESPSSVTFSHNGTMPTFEDVTFGGNKFIKIPTMYRKVNATSNGQITSFTIAMGQIDNTYQVYPCFLKEDGVSIMPYILMGKYICSNTTTADSTSESASATMTIVAGRTLCRNKGTGYQQMDWMIFKLWQDLLICKMQTINTNSGSGIQTDALGVYWGSKYPWVDGVARNSTNWVYSYKPSAYVDSPTNSTTDYQNATYTSPSWSSNANGCISKLGYDSNNPFINYPSAIVQNSSYNTYYCDIIYGSASIVNSPVLSRVGVASAGYGAFSCNAYDSWSYSTGVRLCYRPLSE